MKWRQNPITVLAQKELFTLFNSPATFVVCVLFLVTSGWLFVSPLFQANQSSLDTLLRPLPLLFTFLIPALTMRSFAEEFKAGTIEYLATLPIQDYEIVLGKFLGALGWLIVLMIFMGVYPLLLLFIGKPDIGQLLGAYGAILALGAFFSAVGLWASALTRNQVVAFIVSFFICFGLFLLDRIADFVPGSFSSVVKLFSIVPHFDVLSRGVLDTRDLLYWAGGIVFFFGGLSGDHECEALAMNVRQKKIALTSATGLLLIGVIILLLNVLGGWLYVRWDITRHKAYSLSSSSKKLVRGLDDPVVIKAYFSTNLPTPYNTYARYVKDILSEYRAASHGKVRYEFVPTQPAQAFEERAMESGMAPVQFQEMGADQLQIRRGFMGLTLFYRDRSELLPVVKSVENLEYDLTSRIAKMTRKNAKRIATTMGHGETTWRGSPLKVAQDLPNFYDLDKLLTLPPPNDVPIDTDALLVVGPQDKFDEKSLWAIDQAIMRGIPAAFLVDTKKFMASRFMVMPQSSGLEELLKHYGVTVTDQLVYDAQCESVGLTQNMGGMAFTTSLRYPFIVQVTNFDKKHPILRGVESVALPFAAHLDPVKTLPNGVTFQPLLYSSDNSWVAPPDTYNVAPTDIPRPKPTDPHGPYVLAGVLEGTFPSYFAGKAPPVKDATVTPQSPKTSIFIIGTSRLMDPNLPEFSGTDVFMTNILAYLTHDDILLGIQSKGDILKPLKAIPSAARDAVKLICLLGVPALSIIWGLVRWRRRQHWRKSIALAFAMPTPAASPN